MLMGTDLGPLPDSKAFEQFLNNPEATIEAAKKSFIGKLICWDLVLDNKKTTIFGLGKDILGHTLKGLSSTTGLITISAIGFGSSYVSHSPWPAVATSLAVLAGRAFHNELQRCEFLARTEVRGKWQAINKPLHVLHRSEFKLQDAHAKETATRVVAPVTEEAQKEAQVVAQLKQQIVQLENEKARLQIEMIDRPQFQEGNAATQAEVDQLRQQLAELGAEKDQLQLESSELRGQNQLYQNKIGELQALASQVAPLQHRMAEFEQANGQLQTQIKSSKWQRPGKEKEVAPINEDSSHAEEFKALKHQVQELNHLLKQRDEAITGLRAQVENLNDEVRSNEGVKQKIKDKESSIKSLQAQNAEMRECIEVLHEDLRRAKIREQA